MFLPSRELALAVAAGVGIGAAAMYLYSSKFGTVSSPMTERRAKLRGVISQVLKTVTVQVHHDVDLAPKPPTKKVVSNVALVAKRRRHVGNLKGY